MLATRSRSPRTTGHGSGRDARALLRLATAGKQGGTGLGTYSARCLVEAQGGSIAMEASDEKNATRLTVALPTG